MPLHADEYPIDEQLVVRLLRRDAPGLADLAVRRSAASGSSNALFRLGDDLLVRLPRQPGGAATIEKEAQWLPVVAPLLPVEVPDVVFVGDPGFGYPERWSIVRWIRGSAAPASLPDDDGGRRVADDLADVVVALREAPIDDAARTDPRLRWYRGGPLRAIADDIVEYLDQCRGLKGLGLDLDAVADVWQAALELPEAPADRRERWLHGDLLAENLLLRDDRLVAVLDFGGLAVGDPAVDLAVAWEVLTGSARELFRKRVGVDDVTWQRGRAWALAIAVMTFPYYWETMPARCDARLVMARAALADARDEG